MNKLQKLEIEIDTYIERIKEEIKDDFADDNVLPKDWEDVHKKCDANMYYADYITDFGFMIADVITDTLDQWLKDEFILNKTKNSIHLHNLEKTTMKTFEDIEWGKHRAAVGGVQGLLMLNNGIQLSVVAGPGLYSFPNAQYREAGESPNDFSTFEVALFDTEGEFILIGDLQEQVLGWQDKEDINNLIIKYQK